MGTWTRPWQPKAEKVPFLLTGPGLQPESLLQDLENPNSPLVCEALSPHCPAQPHKVPDPQPGVEALQTLCVLAPSASAAQSLILSHPQTLSTPKLFRAIPTVNATCPQMYQVVSNL